MSGEKRLYHNPPRRYEDQVALQAQGGKSAILAKGMWFRFGKMPWWKKRLILWLLRRK